MSRSPVAFGPYVITRRIARGGMAEIYRAKRRGSASKAWVALKMMRPSLEHEDLREQLFHREARIAALIHHPNVVELLEFGEEQEHKYLAMEYVRGRDLSHLIHPRGGEGPGEAVPPDIGLTIVLKAAAGLGHAHRLIDPSSGAHLAIVHRDISPGNVMVGYDGEVKVLDFGVARINESNGVRTQTGTLRGKFAYMSPEQTVGSGVDARSDVFSLGTVLYELLTGSNPFRSRNAMTTIERVQRVRPVPPSRSNRAIPREVDELLARCLAKDPRRRFKDAGELHDALDALLGVNGRASDAAIAELMKVKFTWERSEEDKELAEEEEGAALIEVIDFAIGGEDRGLDAPNVAVHEEEVADPSAIGVRREQIEAVAEEDIYGVFDSAEEERTVAHPTPAVVLETRRALSSWPERAATPPAADARAPRAPRSEVRPEPRAPSVRGVVTPSRVSLAPSSVSGPPVPAPRAISPTPVPATGSASWGPPTPTPTFGVVPFAVPDGDDRTADAPFLGATVVPDAASSSGPKRKFEVVRGEVARGPIPSGGPMAEERSATVAMSSTVGLPVSPGPASLESAGREETDALLRALRDQSAPVSGPTTRRIAPVVWVALSAAGLAIALGALGWWISSERRDTVAAGPKKIAPVSIAVTPPPDAAQVALTTSTTPPPVPRVSVPDAPLPDGELGEPTEDEDEEGEEEAEADAPPRVRPERAREPREPREGREPRRRAAAAKRATATGFLNVGAKPWAEIEIDGKKWPYQTPQAGIELPVGKHVVRLTNRETGVSKTAVVHIRAGSYRTVTLDLRGP